MDAAAATATAATTTATTATATAAATATSTAVATAASTLSALAVFASTVQNGVVRSVHCYRVVGTGESGTWEKWMEREFTFLLQSCHEVLPPSTALPRILPTDWRGRPVYREGEMVGTWRCILAYDSVVAVAPPPNPLPFFCPVRNPRLMCVPSLYNDLDKIFQFQNVVQKVPGLTESEPVKELTGPDAKGKASYEIDAWTESTEDPQSGEELPAPVQKHRRANQKYIANITIIDIGFYFHLPIKEAAKNLKIGVSLLKKKCRQHRIPRWPHRKIKSLDSLILDLEYVIDDSDRDPMQQEKHGKREKERQDAIQALAKRKMMLEAERQNIRLMPALDLMAETKQFREDVFKRRYRAKILSI